ncbi:MAG: RNA polymerase sigma factor [Planctomycetaceae bacterium]|nr:RNA polymerase sigma factor [Planctomycetales bacterium]MCB9873425.1 RNA polymerase sigma factor [Planctomycetaceae bacterium]MCB9939066.1 RNA polymerase sigma factor [Planctomycetaceae bacterium]HRX80488.1 RNA polymerase sigma factor [Pirellulaceae bacterium]
MTISAEEISDGTLITSTLAGDRDQFAQLVSRYQGPLFRVARSRMGRHDWAEDVVQETFLCAFKSLHTYNSQYSFRTWLWTILLNQCRRQMKKFSRGLFIGAWTQSNSDDDLRATLAEQLKSDEAPSARMATQERSELLDALLAKLPETQADALRLRFFGGLKFQEIAEAMGCSLSSAKNRVRWGLTKLAEYLGPEEDLPIDRTLESRQ